MGDDQFRVIGKPGGEHKVFDLLRKRLAEKGVDYDRLQKLTSLDSPPPCFLFRAQGDVPQAQRDYVAWLRLAAETGDIDYRHDVPGEINYCRDCTPSFKKEAHDAGQCGFPGVKFEVVVNRLPGGEQEKEVVGVSRASDVAPDTYYEFEGMRLQRDELPTFIQALLAELESQEKH